MGTPIPPIFYPRVAPEFSEGPTEAGCNQFCTWDWTVTPYKIEHCSPAQYYRYKAVVFTCTSIGNEVEIWQCRVEYDLWYSECEEEGDAPPEYTAELRLLSNTYNLCPVEGCLGDEYRINNDEAVYQLTNRQYNTNLKVLFRRHP